MKETNGSSGKDREASTTSMVLYRPRIEILSSLCRVFEYDNVFERSQNVNVNGSAKFDGAIFIK